VEGILIIVDGIDGAGKTTQVNLLTEALEKSGESVVRSKEPTSGVWGKKLRDSATSGRMSLEDELHAFIKDRQEHVETLIRPALDAGKIVILDRYFYSTIAYQGARGADAASVAGDMRSIFPIPDVAFLIDADPVVTIQRIAVNRGDTPNHFERLDELQAVRQIFLDLAKTDEVIRVIDGNQNIAAVYRAIVEVLVAGALKKKRCFKDYECDYLYCTPRLTGQCRWAEVAPSLLGSAPRSTALIK
jgi:dTMP kinase